MFLLCVPPTIGECELPPLSNAPDGHAIVAYCGRCQHTAEFERDEFDSTSRRRDAHRAARAVDVPPFGIRLEPLQIACTSFRSSAAVPRADWSELLSVSCNPLLGRGLMLDKIFPRNDRY